MKIDIPFFFESFLYIWKAVPLTLELTAFSFLFGFLIALVFALALNSKIKVLSNTVNAILSVLRGTPAILQIYIIYYAFPFVLQSVFAVFGIKIEPSDIPTMFLVVLALGLNRSAYLTATIRSGIAALNPGEIEAAYTIGMTHFQVLFAFIIPGTIQVCLRNLSTNLINLLHGTSLAFYATLLEIMGTANILAQDNWKYFETFLAAGLIYWILTILIEIATHYADNHAKRHELRV